MRQDQFEALQKRSEELVDRFLEESDPQAWPGAGVPVSAMDKQTRGDLYWVKKNAVATLACAQRIVGLVGQIRQRTSNPESPEDPAAVTAGEDSLDDEVVAAEAEAARLMNQVLQSVKKEQFDKRVHGKS
ncbi:hypothetical protein [Comamonas testosteroni]|nr:hypothetical protein [Comamonas testosteroni]